jgi:hypothetical protein
MRNESCEVLSLQPVGLSRPRTFETPSCELSASVSIVVSLFRVAADRLEAARGTRAIVLRTRLHMVIDKIFRVGIELFKIDSPLISSPVHVVDADYFATCELRLLSLGIPLLRTLI